MLFNTILLRQSLYVLGCLIVLLIKTAEADVTASALRQYYAVTPSQWPAPTVDDDSRWEELRALPESNRELAAYPQAALWDDVENTEIVALGERLFMDVRLSRKQKVACLSCHQPQRAFTDGEALAIGEDGIMGNRRSMPLFGAAGATAFFWDGRAGTLAEQVLQPIANPKEMNFSVPELLQRFTAKDQHDFELVFGEPANASTLARALSAYVASLRPPSTVFDHFLQTGDHTVLSDQELRGLHLFRTKARCINCHSGPLLTDQSFHNIGLSFAGRRNQDLGRYENTRQAVDVGRFRTPSLRGVSMAGPWMHNGLFPTLRGVIAMYNAGMPNLTKGGALDVPVITSPHIKRLELSDEELNALEAFLNIL